MENLLSLIPNSPILAFTVMLVVTLVVPPLAERLRLPGLVGLLVAGVLLGPNGVGLLNASGELEGLLSDIGKVYLMFVAGLEIDLQDFKRTRNRSLSFGAATFLAPLLAGIILSRGFDFGWIAAVLIGSLLASHTLLAYPIVMRLGVTKETSVTATVGATIFTDIGALLVLAMCVAAAAGDFSLQTVVGQVLMLAIFAAVVLFGLDWVGNAYFRRTGADEGNQFLFVLAAVFLAAVGSQLINVDKIVGAFLAGLAVNNVVGEGPVKEKVEFVGSVLFIPFFFICMGLYLDIPMFLQSLSTNLGFTLGLTGALIGSKFLAALVMKPLYRYSWNQTLTMWSLSLPQVAATLAAALVGLQQQIITAREFNAVIVMMLVTSILGPLLTARFASRLNRPQPELEEEGWALWQEEAGPDQPEGLTPPVTVLVSVSNPVTQRNLIELAALLARHEGGRVIPLAIVQAHGHMDDPAVSLGLSQGRKLLQKAVSISQGFQTPAFPILRVDDDVPEGISRTAREQNASLIVMGWSPQGLRARLFGTLIDEVFWSAHCPVAVTRLLAEPIDIHRILVPIKDLSPPAIRSTRFAQIFAATHAGSITLLHVFDPRTPAAQIQSFETDLAKIMADGPAVSWTLNLVAHADPAAVILTTIPDYDMVVLRSVRRRTAGGLAVSDVTHRVLAAATGSLVLFGEPHS